MLCVDLAVPLQVMQHVVRVESSNNPYAIGVVKGRLARQPKNLKEAIATAQMLAQNGYNFSLGLSQVNRYNLKKYGIQTYADAFDPCTNLRAGSKILRECYDRSGDDWGKAFSCYYSGNFSTGYKHGYVQKVFKSITKSVVSPVVLASDQRASPSVAKLITGSSGVPVAPPQQDEQFAQQVAAEYTGAAEEPTHVLQIAPLEQTPVIQKPSDGAFVF